MQTLRRNGVHPGAMLGIPVMLGLAGPVPAHAADNRPLIQQVAIDFPNNTLLISGQRFNIGPGPLRVKLGPPGSVGDISQSCTPNFASTQTIRCQFPNGLPADGDYRLTVANGPRESQQDQYDLTIGAVGPQGPQGSFLKSIDIDR